MVPPTVPHLRVLNINISSPWRAEAWPRLLFQAATPSESPVASVHCPQHVNIPFIQQILTETPYTAVNKTNKNPAPVEVILQWGKKQQIETGKYKVY